jgi:hypothetical protein
MVADKLEQIHTSMIAQLSLDILLLVLSFCSGDDVNILPPLSIVDHAIYQSSRTNRKRISALKHPPFNIARPSLVEDLTLHRDSMVSFVHACESGLSLPNLRSLRLCGSIGDAGIIDFSRAISTGSMANLQKLYLFSNQIGDAGMQAFADAIGKGSLHALKFLDITSNQIGDAGMSEFSRHILIGALGALTALWIYDNNIGDQGMIAFSSAIASGSMGNLNSLFIENPSQVLKDACSSWRIKLNTFA